MTVEIRRRVRRVAAAAASYVPTTINHDDSSIAASLSSGLSVNAAGVIANYKGLVVANCFFFITITIIIVVVFFIFFLFLLRHPGLASFINSCPSANQRHQSR